MISCLNIPKIERVGRCLCKAPLFRVDFLDMDYFEHFSSYLVLIFTAAGFHTHVFRPNIMSFLRNYCFFFS